MFQNFSETLLTFLVIIGSKNKCLTITLAKHNFNNSVVIKNLSFEELTLLKQKPTTTLFDVVLCMLDTGEYILLKYNIPQVMILEFKRNISSNFSLIKCLRLKIFGV